MEFELKEGTEKGASLVLEKLKLNKVAMLSIGTGGGKTYIAIHAIAKAIPDAHLMIIGPVAKTKDGDWQASVDSYNAKMKTNLTMEIFNYEKFNNDRSKTPAKNADGKRSRASKEKKKSKFYDDLIARVRATDQKIVLIMDEAHRIKNSTGIRASRAIALSQEPNIQGTLMITATPITNSYMDSISYLIVAGYYKNKYEFNQKHVLFYDDHNQPVVKDKNNVIRRDFFRDPDIIDAELDSFVVNFDVSALKPDIYQTDLRFDFSDQELDEYRQIYKDYRAGKYEHIQAARKEMFHYTNEHSEQKLGAVDDILTKSDKPIIIFYTYNSALQSLLKHFKDNHPDYTVYQMNGVVANKDRFTGKTEPESNKSVILVQYAAGAEGWNARWSDTTIFYEPTYSYEKFNQSQGRNARAYMTEDIHHYTLGYNKSIEEAVWAIVANKESFSDDLLEQFFDESLKLSKPGEGPEDKIIDVSEPKYQFTLGLELTMTQAKQLRLALDNLNIEIKSSQMQKINE